MADNKNTISIGVRLDDINKTKSNLQTELNKIKGISAKIETVNLDVAKIQNSIQTQLSKMNFKINIGSADTKGLDNVINKTKQATQEAQQYKNVMGKSLNIGDGAKAFDDMQRRANEIRRTVDSLAKISFNTGKNGSINNATLTYTDNMGKLVIETMGWKQVSTDAGKTVQTIFTTLNTKVSDNVQQMNKLESKFESIKSKMQGKLTTATAMGIDSALITQLQSRLNNLNARTPIGQINQLQQQINALGGNSSSNINKLQNSINSLSNRINSIKTSKMDVINSNDIGELKIAESEVRKLQQLLAQVKAGKIIDGKLISYEVNTARNSVNQLSSSINNVRQNASGLVTAFSNISNYAIGGSIVYAGIDQLKQSLTDIKNIDDSMRDLRKVSDDTTNETLNNFVGKANELGISLGRTTEDAINATATFKQLGYSFDEASGSMAKQSLILSNVADMSANDSASSIVSVLKAFKLESSDVPKIIDSINESGNKFALTSKDMAEALKVGGASLSLVGNDLYQAQSLIVAGTEILRDPEVVGNGLKSIAMNLNAVKTKGGETFFKLKNELKSIANTELLDANGKLRNTYDLVLDISKAYGGMTDLQKSQILQDVAGKQQARVLASILQNSQQIPKAYEVLKNSAGSASKEQEAFMNSISGRLNTLKETVKATWINLSNTDMIKNSLSTFSNMVGGVNNIIKLFGAIPSVVMVASGAMTIFNQKFRESMSYYQPSFITNWRNSFNGLKETLSGVISNTQNHIRATQRLIDIQNISGNSTIGAKFKLAQYQVQLGIVTTAQKACAVSAEVLSVAFNMAFGIGIGFAISAITNLIGKQEALKQSNQQLVSDIKVLSDSSKEIEQLKNRYSQLSQDLNGGNLNVQDAKNKKQELSEVYNQLIQKSPELKNLLDQESGSYEKQVSAIQGVINKKNEEIALKAEQYVKDNKVSDSSVAEKIKEINRLKNELSAVEQMSKRNNLTEGQKQNSKDYTTNLKSDILELKKSLQEIYSVQQTLDKFNINNGISSNKLNEIKNLIDSTKLYNDIIEENTNNQNKNADAKNNNNNIEFKMPDVQKNYQEAQQTYEKAVNSVVTLNQLLDKTNAKNGYTSTTMAQILKQYPELSDRITDVSAVQDFLNDKIAEQGEIQRQAYADMLANDNNYFQQKIKNTNDWSSFTDSVMQDLKGVNSDYYSANAQGMQNELSNAQNLAQARAIIEQNLINS